MQRKEIMPTHLKDPLCSHKKEHEFLPRMDSGFTEHWKTNSILESIKTILNCDPFLTIFSFILKHCSSHTLPIKFAKPYPETIQFRANFYLKWDI